MPLMKHIYLPLILIFNAFLFSSETVFERNDIENIAARDIYDILSKVPTLKGTSYGIIGQPVYFYGTGKSSAETALYIDDVFYGRTLTDLSFISVDIIEKIIVKDVSSECSGSEIHIYTRNYDPSIPVSEVRYKDAFFNYRDLSVNIAQTVIPDLTISVFAQVTDYRDNRDYKDDFIYPYLKQNYSLKLRMPKTLSFDPALDISYTEEKKYLLSADSSLFRPEVLRSAFYLDREFSERIRSRSGVTFISENDIRRYYDTDIYSELALSDKLYILKGKTGLSSGGLGSTAGYAKLSFKAEWVIDTDLRGFFIYSDASGTLFSSHVFLEKDLKLIKLSSKSGYFYEKPDEVSDFFENSLTAGRDFGINNIGFNLRTGIDLVSKRERKYYRAGFTAGNNSMLQFKSDIIVSDCSDKTGDIKNNLISSLTFEDRYFNEKLKVNAALYHGYSEYFIRDNKEIMNNLSFNLRVRITDFEFFYGSDNFLKDHYDTSGLEFDLNEHYIYSTIENFDMRTHDEIWGVRWIFFK
ncbi:MAG: Plug domain-containing protein [Candidatus Delongbacteria bacterium]|nr:Plug domain-containing protein [Candidatus Delongbacteria bacterium]